MGLFLIYGDETVLLNQALSDVLSGRSLTHCFEGQAPLSEVKLALSTASLFFSEQVVLLKNPSFFQKTGDKEEEWLSVFSSVGTQTLIIYEEGSLDFRKKIPTFLKKQAKVYPCLSFKDWESDKVVQWVMAWGRSRHRVIGEEAAQRLVLINGQSLPMLLSSLETLLVFTQEKNITISDIDVLYQGESSSIYDFSEAFKRKEVGVLLRLLQDLTEDPVRLLAILYQSALFYLQILVMDQYKVSIQEMGTRLGKNPYFIGKTLGDIKKVYQPKKLAAFIKKLAEADMMVKSGKAIPSIALTQTLVSLDF